MRCHANLLQSCSLAALVRVPPNRSGRRCSRPRNMQPSYIHRNEGTGAERTRPLDPPDECMNAVACRRLDQGQQPAWFWDGVQVIRQKGIAARGHPRRDSIPTPSDNRPKFKTDGPAAIAENRGHKGGSLSRLQGKTAARVTFKAGARKRYFRFCSPASDRPPLPISPHHGTREITQSQRRLGLRSPTARRSGARKVALARVLACLPDSPAE